MCNHCKFQYKLRRSLEKDVLDFGGVIFGGHVRDVLLHDMHAQEFYGVGDTERYSDLDHFPNLQGRMVISSDIDCYMMADNVCHFISRLAKKNLVISKVFERKDAKEYLPRLSVPKGVLGHVRYGIKCFDSYKLKKIRTAINKTLHRGARDFIKDHVDDFLGSIRRYVSCIQRPLTLDILVADNLDFFKYSPPFGNIDFECNALLMTRSGITMSPMLYPALSLTERHNKLTTIMEDIKQMKARYADVDDISAYRVSKMRRKGWTIERKMIIKEEEATNEICLICHGSIPNDDHYRLQCCNARYHLDCLKKAMCDNSAYSVQNTHKCMMCQQPTDAWKETVLV
jgi:hypothetical protein